MKFTFFAGSYSEWLRKFFVDSFRLGTFALQPVLVPLGIYWPNGSGGVVVDPAAGPTS